MAMATYNGKKYLREQLDSLYSQTRIPDEVIVSDDNSSDGTNYILEEYSKEYGLNYSVNEKSLGVNKNFENALHFCKGNYIMICDQDDIWLPNKIETTLKYMHNLEDRWGKDYPLLVTSEVASYIDGEPIDLHDKPNKGTIDNYREFLFNSNQYCQGCTMMLNRALLDRLPSFPNSFHHYPYDAHIAMISILIGKRCHIKQEMMLYRHHSNNVVVSLKKGYSIIDRCYERISPLVYAFYDIPYPRQNYYLEVINNMDISIEDDNLKEDVSAIVDYARSGFVGKIKAIKAVKNIGKLSKRRQLINTVLTYPLRLIVHKPSL